MIKKPNTNNVLVTYRYNFKKWYPAKIIDELSSQFTCEFLIKDKVTFNYYFYKDRNITWKDKIERD